jgi:hypothetical protein
VGYGAGTGLSFAKSKNSIVDLERGTEEPGTRPSKSPPVTPPQPEILKASSAAHQQQQHQTPPCASDHASHTKTEDGAATTISPSDTGTDASAPQPQHPTPANSTPSSSSSHLPSYLSEQRPPADTSLSVSVSAPAPPTQAQTEAFIPSSARSLSLGPPVVLVVLLYSTSHRWWRLWYHETPQERGGTASASGLGGHGRSGGAA